MPQPKGSNGPTARTLRELATLDLVDQADTLAGIPDVLDAMERAVAHLRRRIGAAATHGHRAHARIARAQGMEDGYTPTPLAEVIPFPGADRPRVAA